MDKDKFKNLTFKQKIEWLFQYYGIATIAIIVALIVAITFIKSVFFPEPICDVCILILSDDITTDDGNDIKRLIEEDINKSVELSVYGVSEVYGRQSFAIRLTSDVLDIVVAPNEEMIKMNENAYLSSSTQIGSLDSYIGVPVSARISDDQKRAYDMLMEFIINKTKDK